MKKYNIIFTTLFLALTTMPTNVQASPGKSTDCEDTVKATATIKWDNKPTDKKFESVSFDEEIAVENDTITYDYYKSGLGHKKIQEQEAQKLDTLTFATLECNYLSLNAKTCNGKKLKECSPDMYQCLLEQNTGQKAEEEYKKALVDKICYGKVDNSLVIQKDVLTPSGDTLILQKQIDTHTTDASIVRTTQSQPIVFDQTTDNSGNTINVNQTEVPQKTAQTSTAQTITVSGTVKDKDGGLLGAAVRGMDSNGNIIPNLGVTTDMAGHFSLNIPATGKIQISYMGFATQTIDKPGQNLDITLEETSKTLQQVNVDHSRHDGDPCSGKILTDNHPHSTGEKGQWKQINNEWVCVPTDCEVTYELKDDKCVEIRCDATEGYEFNGNTNKCEKNACSFSEKEVILDANGLEPTWNGTKCVPSSCATEYKLNTNNECVHDKCTNPEEDFDQTTGNCIQVRCPSSQLNAANAIRGKWNQQTETCEIECDTSAGYTLNGDKCEQSKCSDADDKKLKNKNVKTTKLENGVCIAVACISNEYELTADKTACKNKKCQSAEHDFVDGQCVVTKCTARQLQEIRATDGKWDGQKCVAIECDEKVYNLDKENGICVSKDTRTEAQKKEDLEKKQQAYEEAKAKEQSTANKTLTALTTAATGIGGMQLMQGLAEQSADKEAEEDMTAYIETMNCTYGDGKQVKASTDEIELPGANDETLMKLRSEYIALAADLKERKKALGMKPGIEGEEIVDRANSGLYDDDFISIETGTYASLYRAQARGSEADQTKIDDAASKSKKRVIGGAIAFGAGVVVGVAGNSLINGKLGKLLKNKKDTKNLNAAIDTQSQALKDLQNCLKDAGAKETDNLAFDKFYPSILSVKNLNCKTELSSIKGKNAQDLFDDTDDVEKIYNKLIATFGASATGKMLGVTLSTPNQTDAEKQKAKDAIVARFNKVNSSIADAARKDASATKDSESKNILEQVAENIDLSSLASGVLGNNTQNTTDDASADEISTGGASSILGGSGSNGLGSTLSGLFGG